MNAKTYNTFKRYGIILVVAITLSGCALTNSIKNGSLEKGVYRSSTTFWFAYSSP